MASTRDRIIEYLESVGIDVNIGKNKARGNKGFFLAGRDKYRIDIAKGLTEAASERVLVHEFAHYFHYCYDKKLNDLSFIFEDMSAELMEELLSITAESLKKADIKPLFDQKSKLQRNIKELHERLTLIYGRFDLNKPFHKLEKRLMFTNYKYLLKHDKVRVLEGFGSKVYSVENLADYDIDNDVKDYVKLKSDCRMLRKINSKISRLNKYYNNPSELFARAFEAYIFNREYLNNNFALVKTEFDNAVSSGKFDKLTEFVCLI